MSALNDDEKSLMIKPTVFPGAGNAEDFAL